MPERFAFPTRDRSAALWIPYVPTDADRSLASPGRTYSMQVVARLRPGATLHQLRAQLEAANGDVAKAQRTTFGSPDYVAMSLLDFISGPARTWLLLLLVATCLVLLAACANVANLLLARATRRGQELATRAALGASRARLARTLVFEGLMLSLAAAAAGIAVSVWGVDVAKAALPNGLARASDIAVDARVLWVSVTAAVLSAASRSAPRPPGSRLGVI